MKKSSNNEIRLRYIVNIVILAIVGLQPIDNLLRYN